MAKTSSTSESRDDFPRDLIEALAKRAAYICSNPDCRALTIAPSVEDSNNFIYTGVASHITAAASGGPRYDNTLTSEQRKAITNGLFLCATCSVMIDKNNGIDFPADQLRQWKANHDHWVRSNLNKRADIETTSVVVGPNNVAEGSVIVSQNQMGGQIAHAITNVGPQPRMIGEKAIGELIAGLKDYQKESVDLLTNNDPESLSLKEQVKTALIRAGWTINSDVFDLALTREAGLIVRVREEDKMKPQFLAVLNWFNNVGLLKIGQSYNSGIDRMRIDIGSNPQLVHRV